MTHPRRGNISTIVALSSVMLVSMAALAVDFGLARNNATELQATLDAAALAGASQVHLDSSRVVERALEVASINTVGGSAISTTAADVEIGDWDGTTFTVNAGGQYVRVAGSLSVSTPLSSIVGLNSLTLSRSAVAQGGTMPVECGIFGDTYFDVFGTGVIDSWDPSVDGPYVGPAPMNDNGDTCSNGSGSVSGTADIWGDGVSGVGQTTSITGNGNVSGTPGSLVSPVTIPSPCDGSVACTSPDNWPSAGYAWDGDLGAVNMHGHQSLSIGPGVYRADSISFNAQVTINIVEPTEIWVTGDINIQGQGIIGANQDASGLLLVAGGDVTLRGGADMYGTVYAYGDIDLRGNSDFYGVLLGGSVTVGGTGDLHLDESLPLLIDAEITAGPLRLVD